MKKEKDNGEKGANMAWRIDDLIHLHLTNVRLSDLGTTQNPLGLCNDLLDENERELLFVLSPLKQEVFDTFNEIVLRDSKYITTLGQVLVFANLCTKDRSAYPVSIYYGDFSTESLLKLDLADDLLVIIELEG